MRIFHHCIYIYILTTLFQLSHAAVIADKTRIIINEGMRETSIGLTNKSQHPALIQMWIDNGNLNNDPNTTIAPALAIPSIFRIDPNKNRIVRLINTAENMATDRESLFWLNIYEIPPSVSTEPLGPDEAHLRLTIRTQMKLFYRPKNLQPAPFKAAKALNFHLEGHLLRIINPTPYYITISELVLANQGLEPPMLAPFSDAEIQLEQTPKNTTVEFVWIDEAGYQHVENANVLSHAPALSHRP